MGSCPCNLYKTTIMGMFDGTYKMESSTNFVAGYVAMGIPEEVAKKVLDSEIKISVEEKSPDYFEWKNSVSLCPEMNSSHSARIGEQISVTEPFPMKMTFSKINSNTLSIRTEMGGKNICSEMEFINNGINVNNWIKQDSITYSQIFKKIN